MPMFLSRLRAATADEHRRVERASPLLRPDLSLGDYVAYLRAVLGYFAPLARALAGVDEQSVHVRAFPPDSRARGSNRVEVTTR
jgi:heme oxygenase